jgi:hypothetical protein
MTRYCQIDRYFQSEIEEGLTSFSLDYRYVVLEPVLIPVGHYF